MATIAQVKQYLADWFQVGKPVICPLGDRLILPKIILEGNAYSAEFEACWQKLQVNRDCYLQGTQQTIAELLSDRWEISDCPRCAMPMAFDVVGLKNGCPCTDLADWPNIGLPKPHCPYSARQQLAKIQKRLRDRQHQLDL
jgi:hypothetical protein